MSDDWLIAKKDLPDGQTVFVYPLTFGRARISIGPTGEQWFSDSW